MSRNLETTPQKIALPFGTGNCVCVKAATSGRVRGGVSRRIKGRWQPPSRALYSFGFGGSCRCLHYGSSCGVIWRTDSASAIPVLDSLLITNVRIPCASDIMDKCLSRIRRLKRSERNLLGSTNLLIRTCAVAGTQNQPRKNSESFHNSSVVCARQLRSIEDGVVGFLARLRRSFL